MSRRVSPFKTPGLPGVLLCLFLFHGGAAQATLFSDDEARQGVVDLRAQLDSLSRQHKALDERVMRMEESLKGYPEMVNKMDNLNQDLAQMRGRLDALSHQIDTVDKRSHELYLDLDSRLKTLETALTHPADADAGSSGRGQGEGAGAGGMDSAVPSATYDKALAAFNAGDFAKSIKLFQSFIKASPKDSKVPNALYWIGVNQISLKDFKGARATNQEIYKNHPDSPKAPDALLNLASAWTGLGEAATARATLKLLLSKYPESAAAEKAKARLKAH